VIDRATQLALDEACAQVIRGKALTPFLLARVNALTGGNSLASNVQLVLNNATLAAKLAVAYAAISQAR
jgi:pseudouridylate synthase